jgi:ParB family chromosome partitioning protein
MGLKDKASKINFASLITQHVPPVDAKQPKTAPGAMMAYANDARSELMRENDQLKEQAARASVLESQRDEALADLKGWDGAKPTRLLDAAQIRRSRFANRHQSNFSGARFEQLKREIQEAQGNVQPIKVRPVSDAEGRGVLYEVVYGHRRLEACHQLGLPVLAVIDNLDDRTLFIEMERENRERADLSPWEQGVMYARALDCGLFSSNRQLASALGVDHSNLGKSLALARLPAEIVEAFATPLDIQLRWAPLLSKALEVDPEGTRRRAQALSKEPGPRGSKAVLNRIISTTPEPAASSAEATNPLPIASGDKQAATIAFDSSGHATIKLKVPLTAQQKRALEKVMRNFIDSL